MKGWGNHEPHRVSAFFLTLARLPTRCTQSEEAQVPKEKKEITDRTVKRQDWLHRLLTTARQVAWTIRTQISNVIQYRVESLFLVCACRLLLPKLVAFCARRLISNLCTEYILS
jgi:hypothetical protein